MKTSADSRKKKRKKASRALFEAKVRELGEALKKLPADRQEAFQREIEEQDKREDPGSK
jgi:hypothetical protein